MTALDILRQQLTEVATRRAERDALAAEVKEARDAFEASIADKTARLKGLSEGVAMSETAARVAAIAAYTADASIGKKPLEGVTLQETAVYAYDANAAFEWAKRAGMCLIPEQLDTEAFLKVAKATPLPFVQVSYETKAALGKDLSVHLAAPPSRLPEAPAVPVVATEPPRSSSPLTDLTTHGQAPDRDRPGRRGRRNAGPDR